MSFREKSAWIALIANLGIYGFYFAHYASALARGDADHAAFLALLAKSMVLVVLVIVAASIAAAVLAPRDATAPVDERERLIILKSDRAAYFAVAAGAVTAIGAAYLGASQFLIANGLFAALVVAELAKNTVQIYHFRQGA
jgi:type IV secretory pathway TrbL component